MAKQRSMAVELAAFGLPLVGSGILQQLYSWADAYIIGHVEGELPLAAVGATQAIVNLLVQTILGFTLGLSILAAQEYGRGSSDGVRALRRCFLPLLGGFYLLLAAAAIGFAGPILRWMDTPPEIFAQALRYLRPVLAGVPLLAVYNLYAALLRAMGDTRAAFWAVLLSSGCNVLLDILLVAVLPFGVVGAAVATVLSQLAMTVFILLYARRRFPEQLGVGGPAAQQREEPPLRRGLSFALPPMLQNSVTSCGNLILQNFMNGFGAATVLAITTAYRVDSIMLLPVLNLGAAISSMAARACGAGDTARIRRIRRTGLGMMTVIAGLLALAMYLFGTSFVGFFGVGGEALAIGRTFFRDLSAFYLLFGLATVLRSVLEGMGDIAFCSAVGIGTLAVRIAGSYLLRPLCAERTIAFAEGIAWIVMLLVLVWRTHQKRAALAE